MCERGWGWGLSRHARLPLGRSVDWAWIFCYMIRGFLSRSCTFLLFFFPSSKNIPPFLQLAVCGSIRWLRGVVETYLLCLSLWPGGFCFCSFPFLPSFWCGFWSAILVLCLSFPLFGSGAGVLLLGLISRCLFSSLFYSSGPVPFGCMFGWWIGHGVRRDRTG